MGSFGIIRTYVVHTKSNSNGRVVSSIETPMKSFLFIVHLYSVYITPYVRICPYIHSRNARCAFCSKVETKYPLRDIEFMFITFDRFVDNNICNIRTYKRTYVSMPSR